MLVVAALLAALTVCAQGSIQNFTYGGYTFVDAVAPGAPLFYRVRCVVSMVNILIYLIPMRTVFRHVCLA